MAKKKVVKQDNPDLYKLNKYYEGMEKASVEKFVKAARHALYEFPDIELDDIETILHCACLKLEGMIDKIRLDKIRFKTLPEKVVCPICESERIESRFEILDL